MQLYGFVTGGVDIDAITRVVAQVGIDHCKCVIATLIEGDSIATIVSKAAVADGDGAAGGINL